MGEQHSFRKILRSMYHEDARATTVSMVGLTVIGALMVVLMSFNT